ncbi:N5,N10-methylene tetrahydromethanopterin reductase [Paenibacillus montaniterrae]|uniref:N5,N10-methylene tetrahydromethanopterin reductase n=1 Tax=Paenibacillus montaniterrae TaxID=429341 RepID=A0A919YMC6_9BACL|nr:LLM class flavin-dependent oxidoreductase [Paenibacillus montaniterrae]GIP14809.1 N5,N10-methylene tetrahydromethanopterin reductase [Paenibacillus montaniterrae]
MPDKKQLHLGLFDIHTPNQMTQGLWAHPDNQSYRYKELQYWIELVQLLEKGKFDFIFFADSYGYPDLQRELAYREAVYTPSNDPMLAISALAAATKHLAFVSTASPTYEQPFAHARRFTTLDHLTNGRIGWNVVATGAASGAKAFGREEALSHEDRYEQAEEFLDVSYRLFEASWENEAVTVNKAKRFYADAAKIHEIQHHGKYFKMTAAHACEPSVQRTPVIFQAGSSERGRDFAAKHAEGIFLKAPTKVALKKQVDDIRARAIKHGRQPEDIKIFSGLSAIVADTEQAAKEKLAHYQAYSSRDAALLTYYSSTGIDLKELDPNAPFQAVNSEKGKSHTERYTRHAEHVLTVQQVIDDFAAKEFRGIRIAGTAQQIADEMESWMLETGIDGFNLERYIMPGTVADFVELVVPELQARGLYRTEYAEQTLRERLFGKGKTRLPEQHPAARYRN